MKKFFIWFCFVIMMAFACGNVYAADEGNTVTNAISTVYEDGTTAVSTVYNDAKAVMSDIYPDVKNAVASIARGIGVAADHVYTVLVRKYIVDGVAELCYVLISVFLIIFGFFKLNKYIGKENHVFNYTVVLNIAYMMIGFFMLTFANFNNMLMGLINPEWGAINYILEFASGIIK